MFTLLHFDLIGFCLSLVELHYTNKNPYLCQNFFLTMSQKYWQVVNMKSSWIWKCCLHSHFFFPCSVCSPCEHHVVSNSIVAPLETDIQRKKKITVGLEIPCLSPRAVSQVHRWLFSPSQQQINSNSICLSKYWDLHQTSVAVNEQK